MTTHVSFTTCVHSLSRKKLLNVSCDPVFCHLTNLIPSPTVNQLCLALSTNATMSLDLTWCYVQVFVLDWCSSLRN